MHEVIYTCSIILNLFFIVHWYYRVSKKGEPLAMYDLNNLAKNDDIIVTQGNNHIKVRVEGNNSNLQTIAIKALDANFGYMDGVYSYHSKIFAKRGIFANDED